MGKQKSCLALGDINIDFSIYANSYPPEGGEIHGERSFFRLGGSGCNTARVLQKLGVPTYLAANIGSDVFAQYALEQVDNEGLDPYLIYQNPGEQTGFIMVLVSPGAQRTMFGDRGANALPFQLDRVLGKLNDADHLHVSGYNLLGKEQYEVVHKIIIKARNAGKTISLDPGYVSAHKFKDRIFTLLPYIDIFMPSTIECDLLAGDIDIKNRIPFFLDKGCDVVVLKQSEKGSRFVNSQVDITIPAISIKDQTFYDSTGAGDCFNAGFLYGFLTNDSFEDALRLGNAAGFALITYPHGIQDIMQSADLKMDLLSLY
jgi:sugar/nucleoside kinase (ribokinase family)